MNTLTIEGVEYRFRDGTWWKMYGNHPVPDVPKEIVPFLTALAAAEETLAEQKALSKEYIERTDDCMERSITRIDVLVEQNAKLIERIKSLERYEKLYIARKGEDFDGNKLV